MFLDGIALAGYRSFGGEIQRLYPLSKINLLIGQNNSGKSNILRFLHKHFCEIVGQSSSNPSFDKNIDHHKGENGVELIFGIGVSPDSNRYDKFIKANKHIAALLGRLFGSPLAAGTGYLWFDVQFLRGTNVVGPSPKILDKLKLDSALSHSDWHALWHHLHPSASGGSIDHWVNGSLTTLSPIHDRPPLVEIIPAIREIGQQGSKINGFGGGGIIERLARLQNPSHNEQHSKEQFDAINKFVQTVTGNESATLEIPYERDMILVHMDEKTLPLDSLGTGIHEVIILAAAATSIQDQIVCIEEPELHLHPILIRKLLRYLEENTTNQYFITTHSSSLLDSPNITIFHIRLVDGESRIQLASTATEKSHVCFDLGYRASELMQSNCIVWVEGPSDRIYLNHWIRAHDPDLIEGIHYSIMFYGGRLLNHLSADDVEVEDFISLRAMNRHIVIVIDSDRDKPRKRLNKTKQRVRDEFNRGSGFAWITKGREIENYVSTDLLRECVERVHPGMGKRVGSHQFDHALPSDNRGRRSKVRVDKIKIAREVVKNPANLDVYDLKSQINLLANFIRDVNQETSTSSQASVN